MATSRKPQAQLLSLRYRCEEQATDYDIEFGNVTCDADIWEDDDEGKQGYVELSFTAPCGHYHNVRLRDW